MNTAQRVLPERSNHGPDRHVTALVVTHQRPAQLSETLASLDRQTRRPDAILVVDNDPAGSARHVADRHELQYLQAPENLGPAGGIALGMRELLTARMDDDLLLLVDDDDPVGDPATLESLLNLLTQLSQRGERCAGVGVAGTRYRRTRGDFERIPDDALDGPVSVDYLGGGQSPVYTVRAIREAGCFDAGYFFGFDDAEYGLRLRAAGWTLWVDGDRWRQSRAAHGRLGLPTTPRSIAAPPPWRQYYSARNTVHLARHYGTSWALVESALRGLSITPVRRLAQRSPRAAWASVRGTWAGIRGEYGRTVEPAPKTL